MLEIQALTYNGLPPVMPVIGEVSGSGSTIGRGDDNTFILPDPMYLVSRRHIQFNLESDGAYRLENISSGNSVLVNDGKLAPGMGCKLCDGDRIGIGGYVLQVRYVTSARKSAAAPVVSSPPPAVARGGDDDFISSLLEKKGDSQPPVPAKDDIVDPFMRADRPKPELPDVRGVDFDELEGKTDDLIGNLAAPLTPAMTQADYDPALDPLALFGSGGGAGSGGGIDDVLQEKRPPASSVLHMDLAHGPELGGLFHLPEAAKPPPVPDQPGNFFLPPDAIPAPAQEQTAAAPVTPNAGAAEEMSDIDRILAGWGAPPEAGSEQIASRETVPEAPPSVPPQSPELAATEKQSSPPRPPANRPARKTPPPVTDEPAPAVAELFGAFAEGLGIEELSDRVVLDKAFMKMLGQLLRGYTQGALDLIAGRTIVRQAVRASVTVIAPERNNPLKFSPDGKAALQYLLGKPLPGFMGPLEAIDNAFTDLRAHQIGLVSGMQSALRHVVDHFDPKTIAAREPMQSLDGVFPMARKARLWDSYGRYFHSTRENVADRFQSFFGDAFLRAYEGAIATLQAEKGVKK